LGENRNIGAHGVRAPKYLIKQAPESRNHRGQNAKKNNTRQFCGMKEVRK